MYFPHVIFPGPPILLKFGIHKVFECAEYEYGVKISVRNIFQQNNFSFLGVGPPKSEQKLIVVRFR